ncbi:MAG TPA: hypothetical protein VMD98_10625 [Bryocella sp.]|nr:hypothetical protein [Bryocella sp.]
MNHVLNGAANDCILDKFKELLSATRPGDALLISVDEARELQAAIEELEEEIVESRAVPAEAMPEPTHLKLLFSTGKMLGPGYEISGDLDKEAQERSAIIRDMIRESAEDCERRKLPVIDHPTKYTIRWMLQSILQSWARGETQRVSASLLSRILSQFSPEELRYYVAQERDCEFPESLGPEPEIPVVEVSREMQNRIRKAPATIRSITSATKQPRPRGA